jgi:NAD(P)-dependent dehydrogenase (short-subunit alcohol dehydrogenase family)
VSGLIAVTGGSCGLGAAIVERVAAAGHDVLIDFHGDEDAAHAVAEQVRRTGRQAVTARVDVTDPRSLDDSL